MQKIYSKVDTNALIHIIYRFKEGEQGKMNFMVPDSECLQAAAGVYLPKEYTFGGPHKHRPQERNIKKTQEAFVVISGKVEVKMYDLDDTLLLTETLQPGDCYIYVGGAHAFRILTDDTFFYELKNGPYYGRDKDKEFILPQ